MCTVSNMGDYYHERWTTPPTVVPYPYTVPNPVLILPDPVTRADFDALKREVEEMHELLKAAKRMDELLGTPDCEMADKVAVLRKVAEMVGVDLSDVFPS